MGVWHKYDGINTMAQKGQPEPNDTAPGLKKKSAKKPLFGGKQAPAFGKKSK